MVIAKKLGLLVVVVLIVTFLTSLLVGLLPGDPTNVILPFATEAQRAPLRTELGLDKSIPARYVDWLDNAVHGDLGNYYNAGGGKQPVWNRIKDALPISLELMFLSQLLSLVIAIPLGVSAAYKAGSKFDKLSTTGAFALVAFPAFALGLILSYFLGVKAHVLPPSGYTRLTADPIANLKSVTLPVIALAAGQVAIYMRLLRTDMVATLQEDFILMAKSKGISDRRVLWRHALRPSSITLLTVAGLNVGALIGSALVIEQLFFIPGMGLMIGEAVATRQYLALQSAIVVVALVYVLVNFGLDFLYTILDPRIRRRS
jgi:peptide/nickel transport system permease protein